MHDYGLMIREIFHGYLVAACLQEAVTTGIKDEALLPYVNTLTCGIQSYKNASKHVRSLYKKGSAKSKAKAKAAAK